MPHVRSVLAPLAVVLAAALAGPAAAAPGDALFAPGARVHTVDLAFTQPAWWDTLVANWGEGFEEYIPATVTVDGVVYDSVGVRMKGNSSFQHPNDKKPFRLSFDEYHGAQRIDGLKGLHLDNGWEDPTLLREKLHLDFLREAGVAAPRGDFAWLSLNGQPWGLYGLVEHVDKTFLGTRFGSKNGEFYKAADGDGALGPSDFAWYGPGSTPYESRYELKSDPAPDTWTDLVALLDTLAHAPDAGAALPAMIDLPRFWRAMAADNLLGNLDAYAGSCHNFYAYFEPATARMQWIVWDVGLSLGAYAIPALEPEALPLAFVGDPLKQPLLGRMFADTSLRRGYLEAYRGLRDAHFDAERLAARVDTLATLVRPWVAADTRRMYTLAQFETNLAADVIVDGRRKPGLVSFLRRRARSVDAQFAELDGVTPPAPCRVTSCAPHPAREGTTIAFELARDARARLDVYDLAGRHVAALADAWLTAGPHAVPCDVRGWRPGVYLVRVRAGGGEATRRLVVVP